MTDHAVFLEGWVKKKDYQGLEKLVTQFDACDMAPIEPGQDEEVPVEIDNGPMAEPFETVTRLYGMPDATDVDPTAFLAPFFALFFGICLTDAAYGLIMIAFLWWLLRKIKGRQKVCDDADFLLDYDRHCRGVNRRLVWRYDSEVQFL